MGAGYYNANSSVDIISSIQVIVCSGSVFSAPKYLLTKLKSVDCKGFKLAVDVPILHPVFERTQK